MTLSYKVNKGKFCFWTRMDNNLHINKLEKMEGTE